MRVMQKGGGGRLSQSLRLPRLNAKPASLQLSGVLPNSNENARTLLLHCSAAPMQCNSISGRGQFSFVQVGESVRVVSIRTFGALWTFRYHQFGLKMASLSFSVSKYTLKMQSLFNLQKCKKQHIICICLCQLTTDERPSRVIHKVVGGWGGCMPSSK